MEAVVHRFAQELIERHGTAFSGDRHETPHRKFAAPMPSTAPGRPFGAGLASVTVAIRLQAELKRLSPELSSKQVWQEIYRRLIPGWDDLGLIERRAAAADEHPRALAARRQTAEDAVAGKSRTKFV
jgi:hypothetical protein